jgi:hypothetical protein
METEKFKQIGFKADVELDKIITLRANEEGADKSKFYRNIIELYFEKNPITEAEKKFLE